MGQYGDCAIEAVNIIQTQGNHPIDAWSKSAALLITSKESQKKGCPKNAFLGLCQEGLINSVPKGQYTNSNDNRMYVVNAVKFLNNDSTLVNNKLKLWQKSCGDLLKKHNGQMDIVISLWNNNLINKDNIK